MKTKTKSPRKKTLSDRTKTKWIEHGHSIGFDSGYMHAAFNVLLHSEDPKLIGNIFFEWLEFNDSNTDTLFDHISTWDKYEINCMLFEKLIWSFTEIDQTNAAEWVRANYEHYKQL